MIWNFDIRPTMFREKLNRYHWLHYRTGTGFIAPETMSGTAKSISIEFLLEDDLTIYVYIIENLFQYYSRACIRTQSHSYTYTLRRTHTHTQTGTYTNKYHFLLGYFYCSSQAEHRAIFTLGFQTNSEIPLVK